MHIWNYFAGFFIQAPLMSLVHGVLLWCIIALSVYALNKGDIAISFGSASTVSPNEERLREIFNKINEHNTKNIMLVKKHLEESVHKDNSDVEKDDKIAK